MAAKTRKQGPDPSGEFNDDAQLDFFSKTNKQTKKQKTIVLHTQITGGNLTNKKRKYVGHLLPQIPHDVFVKLSQPF